HAGGGQLQVNCDPVATKRVVAPGLAVDIRRMAEIPRPLAVVEDHFLIKLTKIGHQANSSRTFLSARTNASASSIVLYMAKDARAVAGTLSRSINGSAQCWPARMATPS